jgi:hypothetical protein
VWGGHSCPPLLKLIIFGYPFHVSFLTRTSPTNHGPRV